jgi:hypothetical protein
VAGEGEVAAGEILMIAAEPRHREKSEISNWISDGTTEVPTRTGAKENGPTASSTLSATASAPARLRVVRRFMGAGKSDDDFLLAHAS